MLTQSGSKLLEYNVRLGDPETQAVLPLMESDFSMLCESILEGSLCDFPLAWKNGAVCAPVLVSGGYPAAYKTGFPITIREELALSRDIKILISGAQETPGGFITSGGRVLTVSAYAPSADEAFTRAYEAINGVSFNGMYYRTDIGRA
jgi:phosphoribosylamine--glycine ligase